MMAGPTRTPLAPRPVVWVLAGSDSSSGAGCQADLLTGHDLDVHVCTLVTAITAQNSLGVTSVMAVPVELLQAQWQALINDMPPAVIKIGMLADPVQVQALAGWLATAKACWPTLQVVLDPVGVASSGDPLCAPGTRQSLALLWPYVDLLTPNALELAELTRSPISSPATTLAACAQLVAAGVGAVLAKGGHHPEMADQEKAVWPSGQCVDLLATATGEWWLVLPRLPSRHSHGSGCTLASAVACLLAHGYDLADAVTLARAYVQQGLHAAQPIGHGPGPVAHTGWPRRPDCLPQILPVRHDGQHTVHDQPSLALCDQWLALNRRPAFAACPPRLGFYPVVDSLEWVKRLLGWGVKTLQLRIKQSVDGRMESDIADAILLARRAGAHLFINDHWALALKLGAWGVHLGQEDMVQADLSALAQAGIRVGLSTHGPFELACALGWRPSCVALGHLFPTQTKQMPSRPQGILGLQRQLPLCGATPTIAIGGIDLSRVDAVRATGVGSIAVVSAITAAVDPQQSVRAFYAAMAALPLVCGNEQEATHVA